MVVLEVDSSGEKVKRVKDVVVKENVELFKVGRKEGEVWSRRVETDRQTGRSVLSDDLCIIFCLFEITRGWLLSLFFVKLLRIGCINDLSQFL